MEESKYKPELSYLDITEDQAVDNFLNLINVKKESKTEFIFNNERWFIDFHPSQHSDDIIIDARIVNNYDKFLLVKNGGNRIRIVGWCDKKILTALPPKDIYRNGTSCFLVMSDNLNSMESFKILKDNFVLKKEFIINQQHADNLGHAEMISGILAGLHFFCKQGNLFFKDVNQRDEGIINNKKFKIYTRDYASDEDMLILDRYFLNNPETELYIMCKIKAGKYNYLGYINKEEVERTRVVAMTGNIDMDGSGEAIRRIFSDQYKNISDLIKIYEEVKTEEIKIIEQNYVPLHQHSEWSIGDGFGKTDYIAEQLKKKGFKGGALTDHGTLAGVWEFQKSCLLQNIKPILGCEFYCSLAEDKEEFKLKEEKRFHLTLLVKNKKGWENILKLQEFAVFDGFYYKPIISYDKILQYHEGLIILSGCSLGYLSKMIEQNKIAEAEEHIKKFVNVFGEDFYLEIMPHNIKHNQEIMQEIYKLSLKFNLKCVITTDVHYSCKEDKKYHDAVKAISLKKKYGEAGFSDDCFYLMSDEELNNKVKQDCSWMEDKINTFKQNTLEVFNKCSFIIEEEKGEDTLPKLKFLGLTPDEKLKELVYEGLKKYTIYDITDNKIKERLELELKRIINKKYTNYFLAVWEYVKWAKENNIFVGVGRGSAGASLVAYCLNITECDPIKYELLFDRFISEIRKDSPDIDLDFQDDKRDEVFKHLINTYGEKHCAKIATYSRFHPKGVLKDIARIFDIPGWEVNKISSLCIERSGGDARSSFCLNDTFEEFTEAKEFKSKYPIACDIAIKLEGNIRHKSSHASAMVVSEKPISYYSPINKIGGVICSEWEKGLVEDIGLIKFDILGLKTLTILQDACKSAGVELPKTFEDKNVYDKIFKPANTNSVFQLNTVGMQKFSSGLNIECFSDLYDCTTLYRPSCVSGNTKILKNNFPNIYCETEIKKLTKINNLDLIEMEDKKFVETKGNAFYVGNKNLFRIETEDGNFIDIGKNHKVMTKDGWKKVKDLTEEDYMVRAEPEKNKEFAECSICKAHRKNLAHHLFLHNVKAKKYKGKLFAKNEEKKVKKLMSNMGKKGYIAQQKVQPTSVRVALAVKACKNNQQWKDKISKSLLKKRKLLSKKRIKFLKENPEKHPCVLLALKGNISYQQEKLFNLVKEKYSEAKMEHAFPGMVWCADIFIPSLNADIEYDGEKWHNQLGCKEKDARRDKELMEKGFIVIRVNKKNINRWEEILNEKISCKN